jgi:hypothetical protein
MRQNMAATAVEPAAAADLGFVAAESESAGLPARIRVAAAELKGRGGSGGRQASGSNWDQEVGGRREAHAGTRG